MKPLRIKIHVISQELFQFSVLAYLLLTTFEVFSQGFVNNFFNINLLLIVIIISGFIMMITETPLGVKQAEVTTGKEINTNIQNAIIFAFIGAMLVYIKIQDSAQIAIFISILTGVLIFLFSLLLIFDKE